MSRTTLLTPGTICRTALTAWLGLVICVNCAKGVEAGEREKEARIRIDRLTGEINGSREPDPYLHEERGDALMVLGNFDQAFKDYSKAIESLPRKSSAFFLLQKRIMAGVECGNHRQELVDAQNVTRIHFSPPNAAPFAILALILARSPDSEVRNAKASLDAALYAANLDTPRKDEDLIQQALAAAYSVNGDFKSAVSHQEKAIAAVKGKVPSDMKAQLDAYKSGKEYPYQMKKRP